MICSADHHATLAHMKLIVQRNLFEVSGAMTVETAIMHVLAAVGFGVSNVMWIHMQEVYESIPVASASQNVVSKYHLNEILTKPQCVQAPRPAKSTGSVAKSPKTNFKE